MIQFKCIQGATIAMIYLSTGDDKLPVLKGLSYFYGEKSS